MGGRNLVIPAASMKEEKSLTYPIYAALTIEYLLLKRYPRTLSSLLPHNGASRLFHDLHSAQSCDLCRGIHMAFPPWERPCFWHASLGKPWRRCWTDDLLHQYSAWPQETARMLLTDGRCMYINATSSVIHAWNLDQVNKYRQCCLARWVLPYVACSPSCASCDVGTHIPNRTTTHYRIHFLW